VIPRKIYAPDGAEAAVPTRVAEKLAARVPVLIIASCGRGRQDRHTNALFSVIVALGCYLRI